MRRLNLLVVLGMAGCIETGFSNADGSLGGSKLIDVTPTSLGFGELSSADDPVVKVFAVRSTGSAELSVEGMELRGEAAGSFTVLSETAFALPSGDVAQIEVAFQPVGANRQEAVLVVASDADNAPKVTVDLFGEGLVSELLIDPDPLDYGAAGINCPKLENVTLTNIGTEALTVSAIESEDAEFAITAGPTLPLALEPGEDATVRVTFTPSEENSFTGSLAVTSTEPMGTRRGTLLGEGALEGVAVVDEWTLPVDPPTDILFSLDSSCSMSSDIWEMYNNFDAFIRELEGFSEDWQIIVANEDDGCHHSGVLTPSTPDYTGRFQSALFAWNNNDDYTEALLTVNHNAIQETDVGECNAGFMRPGAMLHIIDITDEPEQSLQLTGNDWEHLTDGIIAKKGDPALVTISAIAGDYPSGCDGASPGTGYYEAVQKTSGIFLSICQNWATTNNLGLLAAASVNRDTYTLSQPAQESTIKVWVNGARHSSWSYDPATNTVTLRSPVPAEGDEVRIEYESTGACE